MFIHHSLTRLGKAKLKPLDCKSNAKVCKRSLITQPSYLKVPSDSIMWKEQSRVPQLPIPTLEETCERYLEAVEPLITPSAFDITKRNVSDFLRGDGPALQEDLQRLNRESPTSWLEGFWDSMYLGIRDPLMVNVNPFLMLPTDPRRTSQPLRAAHLTHSCLRFLQQIRSHSLTPDMERGQPFDMTQYLRLFGTYRLPKPSRDECLTVTDSSHIVVMCKDHFYSLEVLKDGKLMSQGDLITNFQHILKQSQTMSSFPVGIFTADNREDWAVARKLLEEEEINRKSLRRVDTALFVVSLDEEAPSSLSEASPWLLHRDGSNRWWDKLALVVGSNGSAASILEHTPIDGHTALRMWTEVFPFRDEPVEPPSGNTPSVESLQWETSPALTKMIRSSAIRSSKLAKSVSSAVLDFKNFGKKFLTSKKVSPDAFVQMAFQLAYFRENHTFASTYESANTKSFLAGRTETVRTVSHESVRFARNWLSSVPEEEKRSLLLQAMEKHTQRMKLCKQGRGVDRHLMALSQLARHKQHRLPASYYTFPALLSDPSYSTLMTSILSTSNVSAPVFELFGFGPVVPEGLGLAYNIHENRLIFNVTSFNKQSKKFSKALETSLKEMGAVVKKT